MKCPSCQQQPISFARWLVRFDPVRLACKHCHTRLILKPEWRKRYHAVSILVAVVILIPTGLNYFGIFTFNSVSEMFVYASALVLIALFSLSAFFWKRFEYNQEPGQ